MFREEKKSTAFLSKSSSSVSFSPITSICITLTSWRACDLCDLRDPINLPVSLSAWQSVQCLQHLRPGFIKSNYMGTLWEITVKLQVSMGVNLRDTSEPGNQTLLQAQQDLFSPFPATEMHSPPFAAWKTRWEQCGVIPGADVCMEAPKLNQHIDQMSSTARKFWMWPA